MRIKVNFRNENTLYFIKWKIMLNTEIYHRKNDDINEKYYEETTSMKKMKKLESDLARSLVFRGFLSDNFFKSFGNFLKSLMKYKEEVNSSKIKNNYFLLNEINRILTKYDLCESNYDFWKGYFIYLNSIERFKNYNQPIDSYKNDEYNFVEKIRNNIDMISISYLINYSHIYPVLDKNNFCYLFYNTKENINPKITYSSVINNAYREEYFPKNFILNNKDKIEWENISYKSCSGHSYVGVKFIYEFIHIIPDSELIDIFVRLIGKILPSKKTEQIVMEELFRRKIDVDRLLKLKDKNNPTNKIEEISYNFKV